MSVHWPIIRRLLSSPTRVAVVDDRREYRGIDLLGGALHVARALEREDVGDHVGLLLPTSGAFPIAALAAWMTGRVVVPLNYLLKRDDLKYVIDDAGIRTALAAQPILEYLGEAPPVERVVRIEDVGFAGLPPLRLPRRAADSDLAAIVYTSGTSGRPKGVELTHGNLLSNARQGAEGMGLKPGRDKMLGVLPQFHAYGLTQLTLTPLVWGVPVVYLARFMPKRFVDVVTEHRPTIAVGIPSMFNAVASVKKAPEDAFESVRMIVSGSEPLPPAVWEKFKDRFGKPINEGYGLTEMSPATHCCTCGESQRGSVGPPLPGVEQRIVDVETGEDLPAHREGEIRLRGPNLMRGYHNLPELTAEAVDERGFYRTGDIGKVDEQGYLRITGRLKEMMIVGGENVFPREIEEVLERHETVGASGVIGRPDETRGEVPVAFVELADGVEPEGFDEQALIRFCREHLPGYKAPRRVVRVERLPRNPMNKILRKELLPLLEDLEDAPARDPAASG